MKSWKVAAQVFNPAKKRLRYALLVGSLLACGGIFGVGFAAGHHFRQTGSKATSASDSTDTGGISLSKSVADWQPSDINIYDLWTQTNQARQASDLAPLTLNPLLNTSATAKCADMVAQNYWAHNDPSGREPWHFITDAGMHYAYAGENLAEGFDGTSAVMNGWMNSEEHKANILNVNFGQVGFAVCKANAAFSSAPNTLIVVQHFTD